MDGWMRDRDNITGRGKTSSVSPGTLLTTFSRSFSSIPFLTKFQFSEVKGSYWLSLALWFFWSLKTNKDHVKILSTKQKWWAGNFFKIMQNLVESRFLLTVVAEFTCKKKIISCQIIKNEWGRERWQMPTQEWSPRAEPPEKYRASNVQWGPY